MAQYTASIDLSTLNGANGFKLYGALSKDYDGTGVSLGDINGDGFADVIVGSPDADPHGTNSGAGYVVFGKASGFSAGFSLATLDGTLGFRAAGEAASANTGRTIGARGDFNGDGFDELVVPASIASPNGLQSGAV